MSPSNEPFTPQPADQATAKGARVPIGWRDQCGKLLVPLNVCRHENLYANWKCDDERHAYEKCQYDEHDERWIRGFVRRRAYERYGNYATQSILQSDICPQELDKMTDVVESISKSNNIDILPVFITCDPARDDIKAVKTYVRDFHPSLVGLTGPYDDIKKTCNAYRVYFSTPPNAKATEDYLVDHSIFFYLMDPKGKFVDVFGRSMGAREVESKVKGYLEEWKEGGERGAWSD